jgi:hypothetical protein
MKISRWCVVSQHRVIAPLFFEETINAECYRGVLAQLYWRLMKRIYGFNMTGPLATLCKQAWHFCKSFSETRRPGDFTGAVSLMIP